MARNQAYSSKWACAMEKALLATNCSCSGATLSAQMACTVSLVISRRLTAASRPGCCAGLVILRLLLWGLVPRVLRPLENRWLLLREHLAQRIQPMLEMGRVAVNLAEANLMERREPAIELGPPPERGIYMALVAGGNALGEVTAQVIEQASEVQRGIADGGVTPVYDTG